MMLAEHIRPEFGYVNRLRTAMIYFCLPGRGVIDRPDGHETGSTVKAVDNDRQQYQRIN